MKQVIQSARSGKLSLKDVPAPRIRAGSVLVRVHASLISAGTERMVIDFARKSLAGKAQERPDLVRKVLDKARRDGLVATFKAVMARLDEPMPLGYSAAGEIIGLGAGSEGTFRVGQRVALAGAGLANHAEFDCVPTSLVAPIPDGVGYDQASFGTLSAISLAGVRNLGLGLGDVVTVMGVGLVGQLAVQLLALQGARVIAVDVNKDRLELAARMGAELTWVLGEPGLPEAVASLTQGRGSDGILVAAATDSSEPLELAAELARDRARVVLVGKTGTEFPYAAFMKKELSLMVSRSYGPGRYDDEFEMGGIKYPVGWVRWTETENLAESLRLMSPALLHRLNVAPLITHSFTIDQAEDAYDLVTTGRAPHLGVVLTYPDRPAKATATIAASAAPTNGRCALGVIGAGNFARTVLLPELARLSNVDLIALATTRGHTADHGAQTFNFLRATTDAADILSDPTINAVLVATRHSDHAQFVADALAAGKSVLVEKPLALTLDQLDLVRTARHASTNFFQVGFNRRFAPFAVTMQGELARHPGPKVISIRVNAGSLPPESWINADTEGGGRILGELCHFIDLARFLADSPIVKVDAQAAQLPQGTSDDVTVTLTFADGSLGTILYTSLGDSGFSKERIECFAGGTVLAMDNFLSLSITGNGKSRIIKARTGQDKGHSEELIAFANAVAQGGPAPVSEEELLETSLATLMVLESLRLGHSVTLD